MASNRSVVVLAVLCLTLATLVASKPTIYKRNENDKLEPVLVPVSSTVIPLPVYKVGFSVGVSGKDQKNSKPDSPAKLITVYKKKSPVSDEAEETIHVKQISKDEYAKQA